MRERKHEKAAEILKTFVTRGEFHWQTDGSTWRIRYAPHGALHGGNIARWDCGIEDDSRKQNKSVGKINKEV